jgi:hypothetical protein
VRLALPPGRGARHPRRARASPQLRGPPELRSPSLIGLTSITESPFPFGLMPGFVRSGRPIEPDPFSVAARPVAGPPPHASIADLDLNSGTAGPDAGLQGST